MKKIFSFLFVALFSVSLWAATSSTFYFAISESTLTSYGIDKDNGVQFSILYGYDGDNAKWSGETQMTKLDKTYGGRLIYRGTYSFAYDGHHEWGFLAGTEHWVEWNGSGWSTDLKNNKMYVYDEEGEKWIDYTYDPIVTLSSTKEIGINVGETITLTATAEKCTPSKYEFYEGETKKGEVVTSDLSAEFSYTPETVGNKTVKVVVTTDGDPIQATLDLALTTPSVSLAIKDGSSSGIYLSETTILVATPSNVSAGVTPSYVFTDQAASPVVSESQEETEWTYQPEVVGDKTMKVTMSVGGATYDATVAVKVFETWNIYVHDVHNWGKVKYFAWGDYGNSGSYPGDSCAHIGNDATNSWYVVTLDTKYNGFVLSQNGDETKTTDLAVNKDTYGPGTYWYVTANAGGSLNEVEVSKPTVVLSYDSVVNTRQIYLVGNLDNCGGDGTTAAEMKEVGFYVNGTKYPAECLDGTSFKSYFPGLTANTEYTVKAYAENIKGESESAAKVITTRATGNTTIKVRTIHGRVAPHMYAYTETDDNCGGDKTENDEFPGVQAGDPIIIGTAYDWYEFALSNEYNYFIISENEANQTNGFKNPSIADDSRTCFWYTATEGTQGSRMGAMDCPYLTPQLMIGNVPGRTTTDMGYHAMTSTDAGAHWSYAITLIADTVYKFKPIYNSEWYGKDVELTRADNSASALSAAIENDLIVHTDVAGEYTFTFIPANYGIEITYPEAYVVNYGVGAVKGTDGNVTVEPNFVSGHYVAAGEDLTFTRPAAKSGYRFSGWYDNTDGTGVALGADATYALTVSNESKKDVYAVYVVDSGTALDNTTDEAKATKRIINGQLVILRDGKMYNALGAEVK